MRAPVILNPDWVPLILGKLHYIFLELCGRSLVCSAGLRRLEEHKPEEVVGVAAGMGSAEEAYPFPSSYAYMHMYIRGVQNGKHVHTHIHIHVCTHVYACTHVCVYIAICIYYIYICIYTYRKREAGVYMHAYKTHKN